jgi:hypothetical protein
MNDHNQRELTKLPAIVKQFVLSVLPNKQSQPIQAKNQSPFEELYFSFPALEEDTLSINCSTQHHKTNSNNMKALIK